MNSHGRRNYLFLSLSTAIIFFYYISFLFSEIAPKVTSFGTMLQNALCIIDDVIHKNGNVEKASLCFDADAGKSNFLRGQPALSLSHKTIFCSLFFRTCLPLISHFSLGVFFFICFPSALKLSETYFLFLRHRYDDTFLKRFSINVLYYYSGNIFFSIFQVFCYVFFKA